jgi:hypothetical protein
VLPLGFKDSVKVWVYAVVPLSLDAAPLTSNVDKPFNSQKYAVDLTGVGDAPLLIEVTKPLASLLTTFEKT